MKLPNECSEIFTVAGLDCSDQSLNYQGIKWPSLAVSADALERSGTTHSNFRALIDAVLYPKKCLKYD